MTPYESRTRVKLLTLVSACSTPAGVCEVPAKDSLKWSA